MMQNDDKLAVDESQRVRQHEQVKGEVRQGIHQEIKDAANRVAPGEKARTESVAEGLKEKAIREVGQTEAELEKAKAAARVSQIIGFVFYLIFGLIGIEIILELFGARDASGFKRFIDTISLPFLAPFRGLFYDPGIGPIRFMFSYIFALVFYFLLHLAVKHVLRIVGHRKTAI